MYVAARSMTAHGPDGAPTLYEMGDALPQFMSWPHHIRRAMLSQNWVEYQPADVMVPILAPKVDLSLAGEVVESIEVGSVLRCNECDRTFKDSRGLNIHKASAHKQIVS